jgi:hypothetical protein
MKSLNIHYKTFSSREAKFSKEEKRRKKKKKEEVEKE